MEWPSGADFDKGIADILQNDVKGESLHHLKIVAMQIVRDGLVGALRDREPTEAGELRRLLTGQLIDSFADETEFTAGTEIEIGENAFYLLQDAITDFFVVQQLAPGQKIVGALGTLIAIDTTELGDIGSKIGSAVKLGGKAMPDAPAIVLENLQFITPQGKSHAMLPQLRALVPLNLPKVHPRVAVPREANASASL